MSNMKNTLLICLINGVAAATWAYYECLSTWPAVAILVSTTVIPILIVFKQKIMLEDAIGNAFVDGLRYQKELQKTQNKSVIKKSFIAGFNCDCMAHEDIGLYAEDYIKQK